MNKRVFLGLNNTAGVCTRLKAGFEENGIVSDFYSYREHTFGYETDFIIRYSNIRVFRIIQKLILMGKLILRYKYFIYDSSSTLLPDYRDIKILRFFGKKCMMVFTGCDIRIPELVEKYRWNPCKDCEDSYKKFVGCDIEAKKSIIEKIEREFDFIVAPQEASGYLKRDFIRAYFPVNPEKFPTEKYNKKKLNPKLRILHAPSNPVYKGTKYIVEVINRLKDNFDFEFITITNISINELYNEIEKSDLIIDQMLTGIYGLFSIEAMAMYKPVVCYVREDSWDLIADECPIYNASPDTLYDTLYNILSNPSQLIERGIRSRAFVEKFHNAKKTSKKFYALFEKA
ncbi:MAG: glycosyltransferase [Ignavibacteria bacterium]|nr:glycosyltransferase [Ignavibacteria bacterium]